MKYIEKINRRRKESKEPMRCKRCGKIISGKRGKPNKSGLCSNCWAESKLRRYEGNKVAYKNHNVQKTKDI